MSKKKVDKYLSCPICKHGLFTEWAKQVTSQEGVRIDASGQRNYDQADASEFGHECEVIEWTCDNCGVSVRFSSDHTLHAVPEN